MLKLISRFHVFVYRLTRGRIGGRLGRHRVLLLTTTRRNPGKSLTVPLLYLEDAGSVIVVASKGGSPKHPAWYFNLEREPTCAVRIMGERIAMRAEIVAGAEREPLWERVVAEYAGYAGYQRKTERIIPLVRLHPSRPL